MALNDPTPRPLPDEEGTACPGRAGEVHRLAQRGLRGGRCIVVPAPASGSGSPRRRRRASIRGRSGRLDLALAGGAAPAGGGPGVLPGCPPGARPPVPEAASPGHGASDAGGGECGTVGADRLGGRLPDRVGLGVGAGTPPATGATRHQRQEGREGVKEVSVSRWPSAVETSPPGMTSAPWAGTKSRASSLPRTSSRSVIAIPSSPASAARLRTASTLQGPSQQQMA